MQCNAPQRLDENGNVTQEYKKFMYSYPENPKSMTHDQILEWFISRRGGTKEEIKAKLGDRFEKVMNLWYSRFMKPSKWEKRFLVLTGIGMELEDWKILKTYESILDKSLYNKYDQILTNYCIYDLYEDDALLRS